MSAGMIPNDKYYMVVPDIWYLIVSITLNEPHGMCIMNCPFVWRLLSTTTNYIHFIVVTISLLVYNTYEVYFAYITHYQHTFPTFLCS